MVDVAIDVIVAEGDLADFAEAVRHPDGSQGGAVFADGDGHATPVVQDVESDGLTVDGPMAARPVAGDAGAGEGNDESGQGNYGDGEQG